MTDDEILLVIATKYPNLYDDLSADGFVELRLWTADALTEAATVLRTRAANWRVRESVGGNVTEAGRVVTDADAAADDLVELARMMRGRERREIGR